MKKVIKSANSAVNYRKIKIALSKMQELIDILDSMDEVTYGAFDYNSVGDVYTTVADSIMSIKSGAFNSEHFE